MNDIQNAILKVAKEVHKICIQNGIDYCMLGGTILGAIRHQGFIPWDDDIDFGMTLPNYMRFIDVLKKINHPWLSYDIPSKENKDYYKLFIKVYDKNTTLLEKQRNPADAKGVFVDIFVIGFVGNTPKTARNIWKKYNFWRALLDRKRYTLYETFNLKDCILRFFSLFFSHSYITNKSYKFFEATHNEKNKYGIIYDGFENEITLSDFYRPPYKLYKFEDTEFLGMSDYNGYLTAIFHDYMQLPPIEKRVNAHVKFCDLKLPYEEFRNNLMKK